MQQLVKKFLIMILLVFSCLFMTVLVKAAGFFTYQVTIQFTGELSSERFGSTQAETTESIEIQTSIQTTQSEQITSEEMSVTTSKESEEVSLETSVSEESVETINN